MNSESNDSRRNDSGRNNSGRADSKSDRAESDASASSGGGRVVLLSGDLMFASRVQAAAQRAGLDFQLAGSLPQSDGEQIGYVILDLSTRGGLAAELPAQCQTRCPQAQVIAYGPHVQVTKLKTAREAGIGRVLTRSQFNTLLPQLFGG